MKYTVLSGQDIQQDAGEITRTIDTGLQAVFVYTGSQRLYDYIEALSENGLASDYLYKFKVCYDKFKVDGKEKKLQISYSSRNGKRQLKLCSMSSLINELDGAAACKIVVENDERVQLAFIVQQLIYIEYPLDKVDILLRQEEKDAAKTKRFMKNVDKLLYDCESAVARLQILEQTVAAEADENNKTKQGRLKDIKDALDSCEVIKQKIHKAKDVELKFAVAASKKAGKSVIVNCFLGEQIAPTSVELATPNNCIYKKSPDDMYRLQVGDEAVRDFAQRAEIAESINKRFREAQNDKEHDFLLPDMTIQYPTAGNNFSSYTIYDTAGPDAAGTSHAEAAKKAMQACDVAVFAIDYSKYLTTSEEEYLKDVKSTFAAQNKFHSLIFALNKIDVRYNDTGSHKSFVKSVDFIRTRLDDIDEAYRDCIIFPTSSLEYFYAIEAENAGVSELKAENKLPVEKMRDVKFAHRNVPALAWLHQQAENLDYYHGIKEISYDVFKKDSGMPALMSYVSYVAQSKAREEIVNNVTFEISAQKTKIKSILDFIANIEAFINADDSKIKIITGIIGRYEDAVKSILAKKFNEDDLSGLDRSSLLSTNNGDYQKIIDAQRKALKLTCDKHRITTIMYQQMIDKIWNRVKDAEKIDGNEIDSLFGNADFKEIANTVSKKTFDEATQQTLGQMRVLSREVTQIVSERQKALKRKSAECRDDLAKENVCIVLPEIPEFEFAAAMRDPGDIIVKVNDVDLYVFDKLSELFKKKFFGNIWTFFKKNVFRCATDKDYKRKFTASKDDFVKTCKKELYDAFTGMVSQNDIVEKLSEKVNACVIDDYMARLIDELQNGFEEMNKAYLECMTRFKKAIDDRDKVKADIENHNTYKANIEEIGACTRDFMETWDGIIFGLSENEDEEEPKAPAAV